VSSSLPYVKEGKIAAALETVQPVNSSKLHALQAYEDHRRGLYDPGLYVAGKRQGLPRKSGRLYEYADSRYNRLES
jgi:hypothetical protein